MKTSNENKLAKYVRRRKKYGAYKVLPKVMKDLSYIKDNFWEKDSREEQTRKI